MGIFGGLVKALKTDEGLLKRLKACVNKKRRVPGNISDRGPCIGGINVRSAEAIYNARYVGYYSIPGVGDGPYLVFWRPELSEREQKLGYDQYFGLYRDPVTGDAHIFNAKKIRDARFSAIEFALGEFICSRSVHDMVYAPNGAWLDGGPFYTRYSPDHRPTHVMTIVDGYEVFTPEEEFNAPTADA